MTLEELKDLFEHWHHSIDFFANLFWQNFERKGGW